MRTLSRVALAATLTSSLLSVAAGTAGPAVANPIPSARCDAGLQVFENTTQGVTVRVYTIQSAPNATSVCVRVQQGTTSRGGEFVVTTGTPGGGVTGVPEPSSDTNATACTAAVPNAVPGTHPMSSGGVAGMPYLIDAALSGTTAQICVLAADHAVRVVLPVTVPTVNVNPGTTVVFNRDPGT